MGDVGFFWPPGSLLGEIDQCVMFLIELDRKKPPRQTARGHISSLRHHRGLHSGSMATQPQHELRRLGISQSERYGRHFQVPNVRKTYAGRREAMGMLLRLFLQATSPRHHPTQVSTGRG
jgi:hypothetical protein